MLLLSYFYCKLLAKIAGSDSTAFVSGLDLCYGFKASATPNTRQVAKNMFLCIFAYCLQIEML